VSHHPNEHIKEKTGKGERRKTFTLCGHAHVDFLNLNASNETNKKFLSQMCTVNNRETSNQVLLLFAPLAE